MNFKQKSILEPLRENMIDFKSIFTNKFKLKLQV